MIVISSRQYLRQTKQWDCNHHRGLVKKIFPFTTSSFFCSSLHVTQKTCVLKLIHTISSFYRQVWTNKTIQTDNLGRHLFLFLSTYHRADLPWRIFWFPLAIYVPTHKQYILLPGISLIFTLVVVSWNYHLPNCTFLT